MVQGQRLWQGGSKFSWSPWTWWGSQPPNIEDRFTTRRQLVQNTLAESLDRALRINCSSKMLAYGHSWSETSNGFSILIWFFKCTSHLDMLGLLDKSWCWQWEYYLNNISWQEYSQEYRVVLAQAAMIQPPLPFPGMSASIALSVLQKNIFPWRVAETYVVKVDASVHIYDFKEE